MSSPSAAPEPAPQELVARPVTPGIRTSDGEREQVVQRLHHALGEGRLDLDETDARVAAAYAARYRSDLVPLLADLPDGLDNRGGRPGAVSGPDAPAWTTVWTSAVWRARVVVLGAPATAPPTAAQCRSATLIALLALAWFAACALLGAAMVAA